MGLLMPTKAWISVMQGRSLVISGMVSCILLVRLPAVRILRECGDEDNGGSDDFEDCTRGHTQALLDGITRGRMQPISQQERPVEERLSRNSFYSWTATGNCNMIFKSQHAFAK